MNESLCVPFSRTTEQPGDPQKRACHGLRSDHRADISPQDPQASNPSDQQLQIAPMAIPEVMGSPCSARHFDATPSLMVNEANLDAFRSAGPLTQAKLSHIFGSENSTRDGVEIACDSFTQDLNAIASLPKLTYDVNSMITGSRNVGKRTKKVSSEGIVRNRIERVAMEIPKTRGVMENMFEESWKRWKKSASDGEVKKLLKLVLKEMDSSKIRKESFTTSKDRAFTSQEKP